MRKIFILSILLFSASVTYSQECPPEKVCLSPDAAQAAVVAHQTVKAQAEQIKALEQAVKDAQDNTQKMAIEFARASGELTALKQNAISDRAIMEVLLKNSRPKRIGLINLF